MTKEIQFSGNLTPFVRAGVAVLGVLFLAIIVSRIVYPFSGVSWEAYNWMPATHLLEGKSPYAFALAPPFGMSPYGVVFYALIAVGVKLFGFQLWFGKILSVAGFAICVFSAGKITRKITRSREAMWFAWLASLAMFPSQFWIALMRPDLVAAGFALLAVALVFTFEEERKTSPALFAAIILLSLAAFFTKQTSVLPAGIIFLRFLQLKKWREAILFAASIIVLAASAMFLLNYTSSGGYFWQHFTHAQRLPYWLGNAVRVFVEMLKTPTFFFSLVFLFVFAALNRKSLSREKLAEILRSPKFLIFLYFLISLGWTFASTGRIGGNPNYYIENSFALAAVCAVIYDYFRQSAKARWSLAMIVLLVLGGAFQQVRVLRGEYFRWQGLPYYREIFETVGKIAPPQSRCISTLPELVVWNGCEFYFDDFEEYDGNWSPELGEAFAREVGTGGYAAIIWYDDKFAEKFPNYRLVPMSQKIPEKYAVIYLYVPK